MRLAGSTSDFIQSINAEQHDESGALQNLESAGKTQDEQFRYCIQARAEIYATACRVIAKLLRAEIKRGISETGGNVGGKTSEKRKREVIESRRSNEELFKAALRKHHRYESDGSVLNFAPISARGIEKLMEGHISDTTAGRLLNKHFGSAKEYREACASKTIGRSWWSCSAMGSMLSEPLIRPSVILTIPQTLTLSDS